MESNSTVETEIEKAAKAIKGGWVAALVSAAITLVVTILGATGTADLGLNADWYMLVDVGLLLILAFFIYKKSRIAATIMFGYFLLAKIFIIVETGQFQGFIMAFVFLFFYGNAMLGTYRYHRLKTAEDAVDVF